MSTVPLLLSKRKWRSKQGGGRYRGYVKAKGEVQGYALKYRGIMIELTGMRLL